MRGFEVWIRVAGLVGCQISGPYEVLLHCFPRRILVRGQIPQTAVRPFFVIFRSPPGDLALGRGKGRLSESLHKPTRGWRHGGAPPEVSSGETLAKHWNFDFGFAPVLLASANRSGGPG